MTDHPTAESDAPWPFGAESALRLIAATGNPNERKENRDAWAVTMPARPDVMAIEIARARARLEQAIAYVLPPAEGRALPVAEEPQRFPWDEPLTPKPTSDQEAPC